MNTERGDLVYFAKLAQQAKRYDEMVVAMKKLARLDVELTVEERNLIDARRASWRILFSIEHEEQGKGNDEQNMIKEYRHKVEDELSKICSDILVVVDEHLLSSSSSAESTVYYHKIKGDYYRYLAEIKFGDEHKEVADLSLRAYEAASSTASTDLPPTHPIRLSLALNLSVFYNEILNSPERACYIAKASFDEAVAELDSLGEDSDKDTSHSRLIMQFLRDNLTLWTSDISSEEGGGGELCVNTENPMVCSAVTIEPIGAIGDNNEVCMGNKRVNVNVDTRFTWFRTKCAYVHG